jgi:hypothetical protein
MDEKVNVVLLLVVEKMMKLNFDVIENVVHRKVEDVYDVMMLVVLFLLDSVLH